MRIGVLGAGIVGVTTAYELARSGHEVTVFERRDSVAAETSYANAGVVAPGYVTPWAAPGMPWKVMSQLLNKRAPVRLAGVSALREWRWMWRWWRACNTATHVANRSAMQRMAHFSQRRLQLLTLELGLNYEQSQGYMVLLRDQKAVDQAQTGLALLRELDVHHELLDAARCRVLEPGLSPETPLTAAISLPQDGVGNCRQFAHLLRQQAQALGVRYEFGASVTSLKAAARPHLTLANGSNHEFDAVVVCAGVQANRVLQGIGLRLPLAPVYGYSVTAPLRGDRGHDDLGPRSAVMDERYKVAISRLGSRVRVAGSAELGGQPGTMSAAPLQTLYRVLNDWFPGATRNSQAQVWKGARPMLPDGPPVVGESGAPGVWLNLGHGSSGWALACGCALALAERISGRQAPLDMARLGRERLQA